MNKHSPLRLISLSSVLLTNLLLTSYVYLSHTALRCSRCSTAGPYPQPSTADLWQDFPYLHPQRLGRSLRLNEDSFNPLTDT